MPGALQLRSGALTTEDLDRCLLAIARRGGNCVRAAEDLEALGITVDQSTLWRWKKEQHTERYLELAAGLSRKEAESGIEQAYRESIVEFQEIGQDMRQRLAEGLGEIDAKDLPKALRDVTLAGAVATDKYLLIGDRPTLIVETRNPDYYEAQLRELVGEIVDAEVVEEDGNDSQQAESASVSERSGATATSSVAKSETRGPSSPPS